MTAENSVEETPVEMVVEAAPPNTHHQLPPDICEIVESLSSNCKIIFKSQQIDDQELQRHEKIQIATEIFVRNRQTFLRRFGGYMSEHHLAAFARSALGEQTAPLKTDEHDDEIQYMLHDFQRKLQTRRRDVKNRRYAAMQDLIRDGEYFSEQEMMKRAPELYQELIGQYLSEAEKKQRDGYDVRNTTFSGILMHTMQQKEMDQVLNEAEKKLEQNDATEELEDGDVDARQDEENAGNSLASCNNEHEEVPTECRQQWGNFENEQIACSTSKVLKAKPTKKVAVCKGKPALNLITAGERDLLRQEFLSIMHERFLGGQDADFDYEAVDDNSQLDDLKTLNQDKEDAYFEASDDEDATRSSYDREIRDDEVAEQSEDELDIYMSHLNKHHSLQRQY